MTRHRRSRIVELVRQHGAVRVGELADQFDVSEVTIRSDLEQLERDGQLIRDRGGAIAAPSTPVRSLLRVDQRATLNLDAKRRIGLAAATLVEPGDTIILDAGTTAIEAARGVAGITPLTVLTNALNVALELGAHSEARVILLGGTLNREASSTVGAQAEQHVGEFIAQKLFLGAQAVDFEHGLTDTTPEIAQVKRAMIRAARRVILLVDSSKWGCSGFSKVAPLTALDTIITDSALPAEARAAIEQLGIELIVA
jgi:DeoR family transcriptional regulator of aga operon